MFENDFSNDKEYLKRANSETLSEIKTVSERASIRDKVTKILRYSYFARLVRKVQQQLIFLSLNKRNSSSQNFLQNKGVLANENERKQTYEAILLLKDYADKINARIFLFVVPN